MRIQCHGWLMCLAVSLTLAPLSVSAAKPSQGPDPISFAQDLAKAKRWKDVTNKLKESFPAPVVKEFEDVTNDLPFPKIRAERNSLILGHKRKNTKFNKLEINDPETGRRVTLVFLPNGVTTINGKEWDLRPLSKTADEVQRLDNFLDGQSASILDWIVPQARAVGGLSGTAALAHAASSEWMAKSCDEQEEIPSELASKCLKAGVHMASVQQLPMKKMLPIDLKCPTKDNPKLVLLRRNRNGTIEQITITYDDVKKGTPKNVLVKIGKMSGTFKEQLKVDIKTEKDEGYKDLALRIFNRVDALRSDVCASADVIAEYRSRVLMPNTMTFASGEETYDPENAAPFGETIQAL